MNTADPTSDVSTRRRYRLILVTAAVVLFVFVLWDARDGYFTYDEWQYWIVRRGYLSEGQVWDFFLAPHNGHSYVLTMAVWLPLDLIFGMHSYLPYLVPVAIVHVVGGLLLFELMMDHVRPAVALGAAGLFLFMGSAYSGLAFGFSVGYIAPISAVYLSLVAVSRLEGKNERLMIALTMGASLLALAGSPAGLAAVFIVTLAYVLRRRHGIAAAHLAAALSAYGLWRFLFEPEAIGFDPGSIGSYLSYVGNGLIATANDLVQVPTTVVALAVLVVAVAGAVWAARERDAATAILVATLTGAVVFYALVAVRGIDLDPRSYSPDQPRYLLFASAFLLPALAWVVDRAITRWRWQAIIPSMVLIVWVLPANAFNQMRSNDPVVAIGVDNRRVIESAASLVGSLDSAPDGIPVADWSARIPVAHFERLYRQGKVPCDDDYAGAVEVAERIGIPTPDRADVACR